MTMDPGIIYVFLTLGGGGIFTGIGFILRTLTKQNEALALLVARVGTYNMAAFDTRLVTLEADMVRIWAIYDKAIQARTATNVPSATETLARMH